MLYVVKSIIDQVSKHNEMWRDLSVDLHTLWSGPSRFTFCISVLFGFRPFTSDVHFADTTEYSSVLNVNIEYISWQARAIAEGSAAGERRRRRRREKQCLHPAGVTGCRVADCRQTTHATPSPPRHPPPVGRPETSPRFLPPPPLPQLAPPPSPERRTWLTCDHESS